MTTLDATHPLRLLLVDDDEVEGTGIGLSVVKRTVENQGGQVWVESQVGQGATFCFLWPRDPDAKERTLG